MHVLILGYGEMGHAMETLLAPRHEISIWEKYPQPGFRSVRLEEAAPLADIIVFCLPVNPHREVLKRIEPALKPGGLPLSIAKGLDESGRTACGIFDSVLGDRSRYALLYGPMIAEELRAGRAGFAQAGCQTKALFERVEDLFYGSRLYLSHSTDLTGLSWSVVLKNVYAIAFGVADGLNMGDNVRGFLVVEALRELERIVVDMGGEAATARALAGLGDLVTTATSTGSHHRALGTRLARGDTEDISGEGVHTLAMLATHELIDIENYPLMSAVREIIRQPAAARERLARYVRNPPRP